MKPTWLQRIHNLRCPECDAVQPPFGLLTTFVGGMHRVRLNEFAPCSNCGVKLQLLPKHGAAKLMLSQMLTAVAALVVFVAVFIAATVVSTARFGLWGLLVWPVLIILWKVIAFVAYQKIAPNFREVRPL